VKTKRKALLLALMAGVSFWVLDAVLSFFFFQGGPFLDALILNVSFYHIFVRLTAILVAVTFALVGSSQAVKRRQSEHSLQESEEKYRSLFANMLEGFAYCKILLDKNNQPEDFVYLEVNDAFERLTGLRKEDIIGKRATQVIPGIKESHPELFRIYGHVALTGEKDKFDIYFKPLHIWLSISVYSPQKEYFFVVFDNISERKKDEENIHWHQRRLRFLAAELGLAEDRERRRIASDLHDEVAQTLAAVKLKLQAVEEEVQSSGDVAKWVNEIRSMIEKTIENTRSLVFDLSPPVLHELGLEPAVQWIIEKIRLERGLAITFEDDGQSKPVAEDMRTVLFRAIRELLMNITKHAGTEKAKIRLARKGSDIQVQVEDNGRGFDWAEVLSRKDLTGGFGLFNIRERLDYFGGKLQVESEPGHGTRVTLVAPLKK